MDQLIGLLRNYLRNDFAEYNSKPYQTETRHALLNLCSYAYDAEVRLGARMVLDYVSAHIAVSSNDLRRMVPFRRRNDDAHIHLIPEEPGFLDISLLDGYSADPIMPHFALLAVNTRAYQWRDQTRRWRWGIDSDKGKQLVLEALSDYRLPPCIHDLFVNDLHRRFYQRLHRHIMEEPGDQRNCDNMEIYFSSPSYLITAGGEPANHAIPGVTFIVELGYDQSNKGVSVPISFMPTGLCADRTQSMKKLGELLKMSALPLSLSAIAEKVGIPKSVSFKELSAAAVSPNQSRQLIQLSRFSSTFENYDDAHEIYGPDTKNYGVAPDFACGYSFYLPDWAGISRDNDDGVFFVDKKSYHGDEPAGFFLAIIKQGDFMLLEAFDTWLHPDISFEDFKRDRNENNRGIQLKSGQETVYTTYFRNKIHFVIWNSGEIDSSFFGSKILHIEYASGDPVDTLVNAGNYTDQSQFLSGTILKSVGDAKIEIHNPSLDKMIVLNWSDPSHLVRISEDGTVQEAGKNRFGQLSEVWVDFDWNGNQEGDFYRPFNTIASAVDAVADGGLIKIVPGTTLERPFIHTNKKIRLSAPIGGVIIGSRFTLINRNSSVAPFSRALVMLR